MSSAYTPNLGIEQPATGMYPGTWGTVANRSYAVLDAAIGGSASISISATTSTSPFLLTTSNAVPPSSAIYPLLIWIGTETAGQFVKIQPNTEQRLYIMNNQTSGGQTITFSQGTGTTFVLQSGYAAQIYCDGAAGGTGNVGAAIANPQFNNMLLTGNAQVNGDLQLGGTLTITGGGNLNLPTWLGLGGPTSIPDPLTINGLGNAGQIRLIEVNGSNYGCILRNDGNSFYVLATAANVPYGAYNSAYTPLVLNLANGNVTVSGAFSAPSVGCNSVNVGSGTVSCGAVSASGAISANTLTANGLTVNGNSTVTGTESAGGFSTGGAISANTVTANGITSNGNASVAGTLSSGNENTGQLHASNWVIISGGGVQFPDGTQQTTKPVAPPQQFTHYVNLGLPTVGQTYQNNYGAPLLITAWVLTAGNTNTTAYSDGSNPPTTIVAQTTALTSTTGSASAVAFVVLPGQFWRWAAGPASGPDNCYAWY